MARKRINTKFLVQASVAVVALGIAGAGTYFLVKPKESPARYEAESDAALQARDWVRAYERFAKAVALGEPTAERWTRLGDLARMAASVEPRLQLRDRDAWQRALEVDPKYSPAIKKLLDLEWELARLQPTPAGFARVRELAERLVTADPTDKRAAALIPTATVQGWVRGIDADPARLDADMRKMQETIDADPGDSETAFVLSTAHLKRGQEALKLGRQRDATAAFEAAGTVFDKALRQQDQNLLLHFRAVAIYRDLRRIDAPNTKQHEAKLRAVLDRARVLAKPEQPLFVDVNIEAAKETAFRNEPGARETANKIYADLLEAQPRNQRVRLEYADFLQRDPATRAKAIELLSLPIDRSDAATSGTALGAEQFRLLEVTTRLNLASYRLEAATAETDPKAREATLESVSESIKRLTSEYPEAPNPLVLRGRLEMIRGRTVEASRTFAQAKLLMEKNSNRQDGQYYELLLRLADAYMQSSQTGPARELLRTVIADPAARGFIPARVQLMNVLLRENDVEGARRELQAAQQLIAAGQQMGPREAANQLLQPVRVILENAGGPVSTPNDRANAPANPSQTPPIANAGDEYRSLPESSKAERIKKGQFAIATQRFSDAARLFGDAFAEDPKDPQAGALLVQALTMDGKTAEAEAALARAIEAQPDNVTLKALSIRMKNRGSITDMQREMDVLLEEESKKLPDPYQREMALYELKMQRAQRAINAGQNAEAKSLRDESMKHLTEASRLKPEDRRVLDQVFQNALFDGRLDEAEALLPKLTAANADQAGGALFRYRLLVARGRPVEALDVARKLVQDLPEFAQSWLTLGNAYAGVGQWDQALAGFTQALQRQAANPEAMRGAIRANYELNRPQEALRLINEGQRLFRNDPAFTEFRLEHELAYGDPTQALQAREAVAKGRENDPAVQVMLGNSYFKAASAKFRTGDFPGGKTLAAQAAASFGRAITIKPGDLGLMVALSRAASMAGDPASAEAHLLRAADSKELSTSPQASLVLAEFYVNAGRQDDAEKAAREAVRRGGGSAGPRRSAAEVLARLAKVDDAVAMLDGADGARGDTGLQKQRAELLLRAGRFEQAERSVRALLTESPEDAELQNLLTIVYVNSQRFDDALRQITQTLTRDPRNLTAVYYRAVVNLRSGADPAASVRDLIFVRDNGPLTPEQRLMLVEAYNRTGDSASAVRELRDILKMAPGNRQVRLELAEGLGKSRPAKLDEAQQVIDEGLAMPELAGDVDLLVMRSRVLVSKGDADGAVAAGRQAVANSRGAGEVVKSYLEVLLLAKRPQAVIDETAPLLAGSPNEAKSRPAWLFMSRGVARNLLKDRDGALVEFAAAVDSAAAARDDDSQFQAVSLMAAQLGADEAIRSVSARIQGTEEQRFRLLTAMLHQAKGDLKTALEVVEPALAKVDTLGPEEQLRVLRFAGLLLVSPGPQANADRAADVYRRLIKLLPDDILILNNMAYLLTERVTSPNPAEAMTYSARAVEILRRQGTVEPLVFDTHGWLLVLNGRVPEGINLLNEAINRRSFMEGHYHLGAAYLKAGLARDAVDQLQRAQRLSEAQGADPSYRPRILEALKQAIELQSKQQREQQQQQQPGQPTGGAR